MDLTWYYSFLRSHVIVTCYYISAELPTGRYLHTYIHTYIHMYVRRSLDAYELVLSHIKNRTCAYKYTNSGCEELCTSAKSQRLDRSSNQRTRSLGATGHLGTFDGLNAQIDIAAQPIRKHPNCKSTNFVLIVYYLVLSGTDNVIDLRSSILEYNHSLLICDIYNLLPLVRTTLIVAAQFCHTFNLSC